MENDSISFLKEIQAIIEGEGDRNARNYVPVPPRDFFASNYLSGFNPGELYDYWVDVIEEFHVKGYNEIIVTGSLGCADKRSPILTDQGILTLEQIGYLHKRCDISVMTESGVNKIEAVHYTGVKPVKLIRTQRGDSLKLSKTHRVRALSNTEIVWKDAELLKEGDYLLRDRNPNIHGTVEVPIERIRAQYLENQKRYIRILPKEVLQYSEDTKWKLMAVLLDYYSHVSDVGLEFLCYSDEVVETLKLLLSSLGVGYLEWVQNQKNLIHLWVSDPESYTLLYKGVGFYITDALVASELEQHVPFFYKDVHYVTDGVDKQKFVENSNHRHNNYIFDLVVEVSDDECETMDITVQDDPSYLISNFISHNSGKCVKEGTKVVVDRKVQKIEDLPHSKLPNTFLELDAGSIYDGFNTWRLESTYNSGVVPVVKVSLRSGLSLTTTPHHPILATSDFYSPSIFVKAEELTKEHYVVRGSGNLINFIDFECDTEWLLKGKHAATENSENLELGCSPEQMLSQILGYISASTSTLFGDGIALFLQHSSAYELFLECLSSVGVFAIWNEDLYEGLFISTRECARIYPALAACLSKTILNIWDFENLISDINLEEEYDFYEIHDDIFYDKVIDVCEQGEAQCYDVSVPLRHSFYSNGIVSHNTTGVNALLMYKMYDLFSYKSMNRYLGIPMIQQIYNIYFSISRESAKKSGFAQLTNMLDASSVFGKEDPRNQKLNSSLNYRDDMFNVFSGSNHSHAIGLTVWSFILDEGSFFEGDSVDESYGNVTKMYQELVDRRVSRFQKEGKDFSFSALISSASYNSSFVEQRIEESKDDPTVMVVKAVGYKVKPRGTYSNNKFLVFVGQGQAKPRIVYSVQDLKAICADLMIPHFVDPRHTLELAFSKLPELLKESIEKVPTDLFKSFKTNLLLAINNHCGRPVARLGKLFQDLSLMYNSYRPELQHPFITWTAELSTANDIQLKDLFLPSRIHHKSRKHAIHIDASSGSLGNDPAGISCYRYDGFVSDGQSKLRMYSLVFNLRIDPPPPPHRTRLSKLQNFIVWLKNEFGLNIEILTTDSYQSDQMRQEIQDVCPTMKVTKRSVDASDKPFLSWMNLMLDGRVNQYKYPIMEVEASHELWDSAKHKCDHPKNTKNKESLAGKLTTPEGEFRGFYTHDVLQSAVGALANLVEMEIPTESDYTYMYSLAESWEEKQKQQQLFNRDNLITQGVVMEDSRDLKDFVIKGRKSNYLSDLLNDE